MSMMNTSELRSRLQAAHSEFAASLKGMSDEAFVQPTGPGKWTPGQHLDHLCRSVFPVLVALRLPGWFRRAMFGKADRPSRTYEELLSRYQQRLAQGGRASGPYVPGAVPLQRREGLLRRLAKLARQLDRATARLDESTLDREILPHPLLGTLTLREMLCFTAFHADHHERLLNPSSQE